MGLFNIFKKAQKEDDCDTMMRKVVKRNIDARDMLNKAISYRNLGQIDKAIDILIDCVKKYPLFFNAMEILGTTLMRAGRIDEAEAQFNKILKDFIDDKTKPLHDIYANLGLIYYYSRNDRNTALKYYNLALEAPRAENDAFCKTESNFYDTVFSNIHRDLAIIFFNERDEKSAKNHACLSLNFNKNNYIASKIYGVCLVNEFTRNKERIIYVALNIENKELIEAVNHLKASLSENPKDCQSLSAIALSLYYLTQMKYYKEKLEIYDIISAELKEYEDKLKQLSEETDSGKEYYAIYIHGTVSFGTEVLRAAGYKVKIS